MEVSQQVETFSLSAVGVRLTNQDRVLVSHLTVGNRPAVILAVADGMGGLQLGSEAAEAAINVVREHGAALLSSASGDQHVLRSAIDEICQTANRAVFDLGRLEGAENQTGTTLVVCLIVGQRYLIGSCGDSRCYYVNNYGARQITEDHSAVQELVRAGTMTKDAASRSPYRNELTHCLGEPCGAHVDIYPIGERFGVIDEDCVLLLCSDGLHGFVSDEDIASMLLGTPSLTSGCEKLVALALGNGSTDNVSVVAVEVGTLERRMVSQANLTERSDVGDNRVTYRRVLRWIWATISVMIVLAGWIWLNGLRWPWRK